MLIAPTAADENKNCRFGPTDHVEAINVRVSSGGAGYARPSADHRLEWSAICGAESQRGEPANGQLLHDESWSPTRLQWRVCGRELRNKLLVSQ